MEESLSQKFNNYIRNLLQIQDFFIDNLYQNDNYFYDILNKIKTLIVSKIEKNNENQNLFEVKNNIVVLRNINHSITNKILRIINRYKNEQKQNFYINPLINILEIQITKNDLEPILLFSFLFFYINKFLSVSKVKIQIIDFKDITNEIIILQYLLNSKFLKEICFEYQFLNLFHFLYLRNDLLKIKLINHKFKFSELVLSIQNNNNLRNLILKDCILENEEEKIFESAINILSLSNITEFKFKSISKYYPSKYYITKNQMLEFIRLSHLKDFSKFLIHSSNEKLDDNLPNSYKFLCKNVNLNPNKNKIEIIVGLIQFHCFDFLNLNSYSDIEIGPIDYHTFQNLINYTKKNQKIKNLICRFSGNDNSFDIQFFSFLNDKNIILRNLFLFNLKLRDDILDNLLIFLSHNFSIDWFIISPYHSIISNEKKKYNSQLSPQYFFFDFENNKHIFFIFKSHPHLKILYQKKRIMNRIIKFLFSQTFKKIYIETNNFVFSH